MLSQQQPIHALISKYTCPLTSMTPRIPQLAAVHRIRKKKSWEKVKYIRKDKPKIARR